MQADTMRYRNLADWSWQEWEKLDVHLFIAANFNRYCSTLIKKIGLQYLPSDASQCLLSLFCDVAYKPLSSVHRKNLDLVGERRNQVMLGTLKMIAATRMVEALIKEYPSYIAIDQIPEQGDDYGLFHDLSASHQDPSMSLHNQPSETLFYAADSADYCPDQADHEREQENSRVSMMVELLRAHLTPVQYKHIRYAVCDGLSAQEISERTGHSVTNVRIMLLNARRKMLGMVPEHLNASVQSCIHRK